MSCILPFNHPVGQVPSVVQLQPPIESDSPDATFDTASHAIPPAVPVSILTPGAVPPTIPPEAPTLAMVPPPQPGNIWSAATVLVRGENGQLQQSGQSAEIIKCISKAVRLANSNLFFINAFPDLQTQNKWLSQSLVTVLQCEAQTDPVVCEVNLRAQQDNQYMYALISMVRHQRTSTVPSA